MKKKVMLCSVLSVLGLGLLAGGLLAGQIGQWPNAQGDSVPVYDGTVCVTYFVVHDEIEDATAFVHVGNSASTTITARTSDCCIAGDLWRTTLFGRRNAPGVGGIFVVDAFANNCAAPPTYYPPVACGPDVFGPPASITPPAGAGNIQVVATTTFGNDAPGGLAAGGTVELCTDGAFVGPGTGPITN